MVKMRNIFKKLICLLAIVFSVFSVNNIAFAQEPIYVSLNGTNLEFPDVSPVIINNRAMVPIRYTAETLGATVEWNKATETMTISKGSFVAVHKMSTNVITVNGVAKTFDTPSVNIDGRTLMPVIMLSEAIGSEVAWDNSTRTVNVLVNDTAITNVSIDSTELNSGERSILAVSATSSTEKVKIVDVLEGSILAESTTYVTNFDGSKSFSIPWIPNVSDSTYKTIKVVAGDFNTYNESESAYKTLSVYINANPYGNIVEVTANKTEIERGDTVTLTITTDSAAKQVKIVDETNSSLYESVNYTISNNLNVFTQQIKFNSRGEFTLKVYSGTSAGYSSSYQTIKITVGATGASSSEKLNAKLTIHDINISGATSYVGEKSELLISTSADIAKIEVLDDNNSVIDAVYSPIQKDAENNEYKWSVFAYIAREGINRFEIIAYNSNNEAVYENLSLVGVSYNKSDLHIINVSQKDSDVLIGDTVKFTVTTTRVADKLVIMENGVAVQTITGATTSGDYKYWDFRIKITDANKDRLTVVAYNGNSTDSVKLSTYISNVEKAKIYDVEVVTPEVALNEYIRITVYTNSAVSKIWVEDQSGYKVSSTYTSYDSKTGDEYEWNIRIPADEVGDRITYYVYAQDANGSSVDDYFRVKVTK